jgi:hypothetical protein
MWASIVLAHTQCAHHFFMHTFVLSPFSRSLHRKKRFTSFPSPAGMSLTKLPLGRNNSVMTLLFLPRESLVVTSRLGTGNFRTFFLRCILLVLPRIHQLLDFWMFFLMQTVSLDLVLQFPTMQHFWAG